jgi:hypothetical protein
MIHYYINPHNKHLMIYDEEADNITMVKPFSEGQENSDDPEPIAPVRKTQKTPEKLPTTKKRKRQACSQCKEPGHTTRTSPQNRGDEAEDPQPKKGAGIDEATINKINRLYADGRSMKDIKEETGISYPTIHKYTIRERRQQERGESDDGLDDEQDEERPTFGGDSRNERDDDDNFF